MDDDGNDEELEEELLRLMGGGGGRPQERKNDRKGQKPNTAVHPSFSVSSDAHICTSLMQRGSALFIVCLSHAAPVAMAEIEQMAALCMKDVDDEDIDDDDLNDEDLLVTIFHHY